MEVNRIQPYHIFSEPFKLFKELRNQGKSGTSLRMRLFAFLAFFLLAILTGMLCLLMMNGVLDSNEHKSYAWMENELTHLNQGVYNDFGKLSLQGISLAKKVSAGMEKVMKENGATTSTLQARPELLNCLLGSQIETLLSALKSTGTSGAFILLDATVNPYLENAEHSRSGLFLKSTEPNIETAVDANVRCLRGPASIAREHSLELMPQWRMEFEVKDGDYFDITMSAARKNRGLPLSRLYFWSDCLLLPGNSESGMLLCVPLLDNSGNVFGICGFEFSSMRFKNIYSPDNSTFPRIFNTLSPLREQQLDMCSGLIAGSYYQGNTFAGNKAKILNTDNGFYHYLTDNKHEYGGLHSVIELYPSNSVFADKEWITAVMMPARDLMNAVSATRRKLYISFAFLLILFLGVAAFISKRYISPVIKALNMVKTEDLSKLPKTSIIEIDDLFEFLALQDEKADAQAAAKASETAKLKSGSFTEYELFVQNISKLSRAEKAVFDLYVLGHTASEIADILYLSINTIKTHNRRIYSKLNVSSRKELMVYVRMMQEKQRRSAELT